MTQLPCGILIPAHSFFIFLVPRQEGLVSEAHSSCEAGGTYRGWLGVVGEDPLTAGRAGGPVPQSHRGCSCLVQARPAPPCLMASCSAFILHVHFSVI